LKLSAGFSLQQFARNDDGGFPAVLNDLRDGLGIPGAKLFDYSISVCVGELRHEIEILNGLGRRYF